LACRCHQTISPKGLAALRVKIHARCGSIFLQGEMQCDCDRAERRRDAGKSQVKGLPPRWRDWRAIPCALCAFVLVHACMNEAICERCSSRAYIVPCRPSTRPLLPQPNRRLRRGSPFTPPVAVLPHTVRK
jgi:hypothetical protein